MISNTSHYCQRWIYAVAAALYLLFSLAGLDKWPPISDDESWIAAAPYKLATHGTYASNLFTGYHASEQQLYHLNPFYHLILSGVFRVADIGVVQMRLLPVLLGLGTLLLTCYIACRMFGNRTGILAAALLLFLRLTVPETGTGMPLLDIARINRPDIAVPFFGLAALALFPAAWGTQQRRRYFLSGLLIGISSLCHLYGAFWMPALLMILVLRHGLRSHTRNAGLIMIAGFTLVWLPVVIWLASGWETFVAQSQLVAGRFNLLSPSFYLHNLLQEYRRFGNLRPFSGNGITGWFRPGLWSATLASVPALAIALKRRQHSSLDPAFTIAVILVVQALLFATLLSIKFFNYFIALWPLVILLLAWFGVWLWEHRRGYISRGSQIAMLAMVVLEGALCLVAQHRQMQGVTPYSEFEQRIADQLPDSARVLGLNRYWLGLRHHDYRSWLVPILLADSLYNAEATTLDNALEQVAPDVILIDRNMRDYFDEIADSSHPHHHFSLQFEKYLKQHDGKQRAVIDDKTYGRMELLDVSR